MRYFTVESFYSKGDPFGFKPGQNSRVFYCKGFTDLAKTLRCITPKGYRTGTASKYSRWFKRYVPPFELQNLLGNTMHKIDEVKELPELQELEYTATHGFTHTLKVAKDSITGTA